MLEVIEKVSNTIFMIELTIRLAVLASGRSEESRNDVNHAGSLFQNGGAFV